MIYSLYLQLPLQLVDILRLLCVRVCVCVHVCSVALSSLNPCDPMDYSLPDSSVHLIFQARILEWVAISYSRGSS